MAIVQSKQVSEEDEAAYLADSFPIILAKGQHAYTSRVASSLASIGGYNAIKKMYYYGVKAHVVARSRKQGLPEIEILVIDEAARHDGPVFDQFRFMMNNNLTFADKAYKRPDEQLIEMERDLKVITPPMKDRGQKKLSPEQASFSAHPTRITLIL